MHIQRCNCQSHQANEQQHVVGWNTRTDLKPVSRTKTRSYEGMPSLSDKILGAVGLLSVALIVGLTIVLS